MIHLMDFGLCYAMSHKSFHINQKEEHQFCSSLVSLNDDLLKFSDAG